MTLSRQGDRRQSRAGGHFLVIGARAARRVRWPSAGEVLRHLAEWRSSGPEQRAWSASRRRGSDACDQWNATVTGFAATPSHITTTRHLTGARERPRQLHVDLVESREFARRRERRGDGGFANLHGHRRPADSRSEERQEKPVRPGAEVDRRRRPAPIICEPSDFTRRINAAGRPYPAEFAVKIAGPAAAT